MGDLLDLGGQTALVTGAGQGVGRAIAMLLAAHNARVAVNDYVLERAEAVAAEIRASGGEAVAIQADVGDRAAVAAAFTNAAEALGPVTLLVNNAGNAGPDGSFDLKLFWETDPADWPGFFRVNLYGVMNCCHVAMPGMITAGRGRVVTISSDSGRAADGRLAAYAAAKGGAAAFMRSLAADAGRHGITCNTIALGSQVPHYLGPAEQAAYLASDRVKNQLSSYLIRRLGRPEDAAAMALFLCSDAANWITGQTYPVNGGYSSAL